MDFKSSFHDFLTAGNSLNIHHKNLQKFVTEVFKAKNGLSPKLMNVFEFFEKPYSLQTNFEFQVEEDLCNKIRYRNTLPWP